MRKVKAWQICSASFALPKVSCYILSVLCRHSLSFAHVRCGTIDLLERRLYTSLLLISSLLWKLSPVILSSRGQLKSLNYLTNTVQKQLTGFFCSLMAVRFVSLRPHAMPDEMSAVPTRTIIDSITATRLCTTFRPNKSWTAPYNHSVHIILGIGVTILLNVRFVIKIFQDIGNWYHANRFNTFKSLTHN